MFLHVLYSWLLTQVFHPIVFATAEYVAVGSTDFIHSEDIFFFLIVCGIASLPCLLLGWLFLGIIVHSNYTVTAKFFLWLATTAVLVTLNLWVFILFFDFEFHIEYFLAAIPGIISIWIVSILRINQFQKLIYKHLNNNHRETDLV